MRKEVRLALSAAVIGLVIACGSKGDRVGSEVNAGSPDPNQAVSTENLPQIDPLVPTLRDLHEGEVEGAICFHWPVYGTLSSYFGESKSAGNFHTGIDISQEGKFGGPVVAAADGIVELVNHSGYGLGNSVVIRHGNNWQTVYGHLERIEVEKGQEVKESEVIGTIGATGNASGAHLHFEILFKDSYVDPMKFLWGPDLTQCRGVEP